MSKVVQFPRPSPMFIRLRSQISERHCCGRMHRRFFLDLCSEGSTTNVWDGDNYSDALRAAAEWRPVRVVDEVETKPSGGAA